METQDTPSVRPSLRGQTGQFEVDATFITRIAGSENRTEIPLRSITGYRFKPARLFKAGYLQILTPESGQAKPSRTDATTVQFNRSQQPGFEELRDWLAPIARKNRSALEESVDAAALHALSGRTPLRPALDTAAKPDSANSPVVTRKPVGRRAKVPIVQAGPGYSVKDLEIAGERYYQRSFARLFRAARKPLGGLIWREAELVPEPSNPHDRNAVAVRVGGHTVGYVPAEIASGLQHKVIRARNNRRKTSVSARIWGLFEDGNWSARVTLDPQGEREAEWRYVDTPRWPGRISPDRSERLTDRGQWQQIQAAEEAKLINGRPFDAYRPDIAQARATGNNEQALALLNDCVDAAERSAAILFSRPTSWPTEQTAVVYRSLKDYAAEVAILERFIAADPDRVGTKGLQKRLLRARQLAGHEPPPQPADTAPQAPETQVIRLTQRRPVMDVKISEAAELAYEKDHIDTIRSVLEDAGVPPGTAHHTVAIVRERPYRGRSRSPIEVFVDNRLVGLVSAIDSDQVRDVIRRPEYVDKDCRIRCRIYLATDTRSHARITLGAYEQVVAREDETEQQARARQTAEESAALRRERLAAGGQEAADQRRRLVRGRDFVEWVDTIKDLKRAGQDADALELLHECIDAAERDARHQGYSPPPWYTEQAAILYRKANQIEAEIEVLERYQRACPPDQTSPLIEERIVKSRARRNPGR